MPEREREPTVALPRYAIKIIQIYVAVIKAGSKEHSSTMAALWWKYIYTPESVDAAEDQSTDHFIPKYIVIYRAHGEYNIKSALAQAVAAKNIYKISYFNVVCCLSIRTHENVERRAGVVGAARRNEKCPKKGCVCVAKLHLARRESITGLCVALPLCGRVEIAVSLCHNKNYYIYTVARARAILCGLFLYFTHLPFWEFHLTLRNVFIIQNELFFRL